MKRWGFIVQSREADNLPLVDIKLGEKILCLDPTEEYVENKQNLFGPEMRTKMTQCSSQDTRKFSEDNRYT